MIQALFRGDVCYSGAAECHAILCSDNSIEVSIKMPDGYPPIPLEEVSRLQIQARHEIERVKQERKEEFWTE